MPHPTPLSPRGRRVRRASAFTLIELLTVIAIIGILAAILIPVAGRVRQSARTAHCTKNLQGLGTAFQLYAAENRGLLPALRFRTDTNPLSAKNPSGKGWQIELSPYLAREIKTFNTMKAEVDGYAFCPEYVSLYRDDPDWGKANTGGYGMNPNVGAPNAWDLRFRTSLIQAPSQTVLAGDSTDYHLNIGSSGWSANTDAKPGDYISGDPRRHSGKATYLFHDGHVSLLSSDDALTTLTRKL